MSGSIGTMNEGSLHAALKVWYAEADDQLEVSVDGFVVDIVRGEILIEIQTRNFAAMKKKLFSLVERHCVRLIHPVPCDKWINKVVDDETGEVTCRKSPKHGQWVDIFDELVSFPQLMLSPNFDLEVVLTQEDEIWRRATGRAWRRRGWKVKDRLLRGVVDQRRFESRNDLLDLLPDGLDDSFTTSDIAELLGRPRRLAQKAAYCLREMGAIVPVGKTGNSIRYTRRNEI